MSDRFETDPAFDEKLLAKVLLGDDGAARTLVDRLGPIIRRVVTGKARPEFREDLIQEVWAHLWSRNFRVLQHWDRSGPLVNYVAVVALNLVKDRLARRTLVTEPIKDCLDPGLDDPVRTVPDPDDPVRTIEVKQLAECLEKAKNRLSQTYRDLIYMRHDLDLEYKEIAAKLGRTIGYVGGTLARAERYLREEILETCADHLGSFRSIF
jgi:RNA polymerase sigma factor (sigma-70 family)